MREKERRTALLNVVGFVAVMVALFILSSYVRVPWVLEQYPTGDTFLRGLQSNYDLLAERYSRDVGNQFVALRVFAIPLVIGAVLLAVPFIGKMTGYVLRKLSLVRISTLALILPIPIGGAVLQAFYSSDVFQLAWPPRRPRLVDEWPLGMMLEYWFFWVPITPAIIVGEVVLAAAVLMLYFQPKSE